MFREINWIGKFRLNHGQFTGPELYYRKEESPLNLK
jgi:hypothetical protein